jgi:hypothetical protein
VCVSLTYGERVYDPYHFGLNYGIADVAGDRRSYVVGAVREAETGLLFFARRAAPNVSNLLTTGGTLVFDPALGSWSCETDTGRSAISAGFYRYNGVTHPVVVTYLNSGNALPTDDVLAALSPMPKDGAAGRFGPYNSAFGHDLFVDLGNVCPWESCGRGTVRRVGVLASSERASSNQPSGAHAWKGFSFWWRYDGEQVDTSVSVENVTPAIVQSNAGRWIFRAAPPRFRCAELAPVLAMLNAVTDNEDADLWLHALVVDADPIKGTRLRRRAGNERAA